MIASIKALAPQPVRSALRRARAWLPLPPRPAILMYHRIAKASFDPWGLAVEPERFAAQMEWLACNRTVLPLGELARQQRDGQLKGDAVAITFDDGYASSMHAAVPLLERLGLTATIFLPAELVERKREFWWDELARIVLTFPGKTLRLDDSDVPVPAASEHDQAWAPDAPASSPRQKLFHAIWSRLRSKSPAELDAAMAELRGQSAAPPADVDRPVTPDELRATRSPALEFGCHSLTHPSLPPLAEAEQAREIEGARARCATLAGRAPTTFAYPYGDFDGSSMRLVRKAGFLCAVTAEPGFVGSDSNLFALPRLAVGNWSPERLHNRLRGL